MFDELSRVTSPDGAQIATWHAGEGPALIVIHGITSSHETMNEIAPHFAKRRFTTIYDRRGRGQSTDGEGEYAFSREVDDALGVLESSSASADVFAHSFGAYIALEAAARAPHLVRRVAVYSPGFGDRYEDGVLDRLESLAQSAPDAALDLLLRDIIVMPDDDIEAMRNNTAVWQDRIANIHTVARECRVDAEYSLDADALAGVKCPVLVVSGATNAANKQAVARELAEALPNAQLVVMQGEGHAAHHTAPAELSKLALDFFDEG